jgi:hypothetical protein
MPIPRLIRLAALLLLLVPSTGCRQLLKGADEVVEVGRRVDVPASPVRRGAERAASEVAQYGIAEAIQAAREHGGAPGTDLPDLDGRWRQTDSYGDGLAGATIIDRTATQPGVYDLTITHTLTLEGQTLMTITFQGLEVLSRTQQCQFANTLDVQYASDDVKQLMEAQSGPITVATFNEDPCGRILSIDGTMVRGVGTDGVTFVEARSPI